MPCHRAQVEVVFPRGESEWKRGEWESGDQPLRTGVTEDKRRERERDRQRQRQKEGKMGGGQGPYKRELSECAQVVFFAATAKGVYPKVQPEQMPEY